MGRKKRKRIDIADSGALSDLAFLLIIFFIVIAVFNVNKGFMLGLPKKNSTKIVNTLDIVKVKLENSGVLKIDDNPISVKELEDEISNLLNERPNLTFLLKIEPDVDYQSVVNVIEIVRKLEVENFSFSMIEASE
ncbi:MAG: biopolymer transporter ExbD [Spirochaetales bacterium]|nr:biopolymer transporter ExbD [Spirochaetales bacterium]